MEIIKVETKRGLELKGAIYKDASNDTILIMVTGICSNVFQNDLLNTTGKMLLENNISTMVAHTHDSFSCFAYTDKSIGKQRHAGVFNVDFTKIYEDVESYILKAREMGFKKIILAGHSLGSNKIINYLGTTKDDFINYFIISSPIDLMHWWKMIPNVEKCYSMAQQWIDNNEGNDILPFIFGGFSPMTANTVVDFYNADNIKNCPVLSKEGETQSLYNIKPCGSFIIGSKDSVTGDNPKAFMEQLNKWTKNPERNQVIEIQDASHIFFGKDEIYAQTVLNCIKNHFENGKKYERN